MSKQNDWNKVWMNRQREKGLCIFCKENKFGESALCEKHFFISVATTSLKDRTQWERLREVFYAQDERCYLSGRKLIAGKNASIDHIFSVRKNPEMRNKLENLRWCDKQVNHAKNDMSCEDFVALCKDIVAFLNKKDDAT